MFFNPFQANVSLPTPLKTSENQKLSDDFRGQRTETFKWMITKAITLYFHFFETQYASKLPHSEIKINFSRLKMLLGIINPLSIVLLPIIVSPEKWMCIPSYLLSFKVYKCDKLELFTRGRETLVRTNY